ncbi:MAG: hypothetical protein MZV65_53175 [Chromatiales bacterium]|nr:hypothetical protein [Chromatiales bacterium]
MTRGQPVAHLAHQLLRRAVRRGAIPARAPCSMGGGGGSGRGAGGRGASPARQHAGGRAPRRR